MRPQSNLPASFRAVNLPASAPVASLCVNPGGSGGCFMTIQGAVDAAAIGDTINVEAGTYVEDVAIPVANLSLLGSGPGTKTISGAIGGSSSTVSIGASNVTVAGFTITREGNTPGQWNDPLNTVGISIQGTALTGALIRDNLIKGNRTGIDINNSNGHTIRNNVIDDNRTGMIFRNQTDQMTVVENFITNNWTVGILFLDGSGAGVPPQSALQGTFRNNDLSGNWYGQIVDRQSGGTLPAPGTTNLKNFRPNWFGTTSPVVSTANSAEPGYGALIPVAYGGTAVPPGGQPDILGPASANFQYTPFLLSGTDTNIETTPGRGTFGFQGETTLTITPAALPTAADNDYTRINNAIQSAFAGETIKLNGTFNWTEANAAASWALGSDGVASNGDDYEILVPANLNNVTLTANNPGDATIQGPGDLAAINLEGVLVFDGGDNQNWTISNLNIFDFDLSIGMFAGAGGTDAFNNTNITNNHIRMARDLNATVAPADVNQNIGIHYAFGMNELISGNTIEIQGDGISDGSNFASDIGMQSNTSGGSVYEGLQITNNIIRVLNAQDAANPQVVLGIWENAHAHTSNITISGNQFVNQAVGNNAATNLQRAFRVTSHSSSTTFVTYSNNTITGANIGFQWLAGSNFAGNQPVKLTSNTITNGATGVLVQSQGLANLSFNRIVGNSVAGTNNVDGTVTAENNWWGCNAGPGNAGCDGVLGTVDFNPWMVLSISASPSTIPQGTTSTVTAAVTRNSDNVVPSGTTFIPATGVSFGATEGTMFPTTGTLSSGQASSTFTSTSANNGSASTTLDNQTVSTNITIQPLVLTIAPAVTPTSVDNDYTRINNAIQSSFAGQTIKLNGVFNWTEANAAASWALGSDGVASNGDDYEILVPANRNNVTLTANNPGDATIQGPGDLAGVNLESVLVFDGGDNQNWTISNLNIFDFDLSIGMFAGAGGTDAFNNTHITNNHIRIARDLNATVAPADASQNIGIHFSFGTNELISGNTIEIQGDGISNGSNFASDVGMQSNTSGGSVYEGLQITNNIIRVLNAQDAGNPQVVLGIWENAHAHTSNITISGNQFVNQAAGNNPATNLQRAFRVTSHSSSTTTVIYRDNTITGANIGFQWLAGSNFSGNQPVKLTSNTIINGATGVLVQSQGLANLSFNRIVGNSVAGTNNVDGTVTAENNWWGCNAGPGNAGCDGVLGTVDFNPWMVLSISASPTTVLSGGSSTVTADMTNNSDSLVPSATVFVPATLVTFGATEGTMFPTTATLSSGQAASNFTSTSANNGSASATVDNQTVSAPITVIPPVVLSPVVTGTKTVSGPFAPGNTVTYTIVLSNTGPGAQLDNTGDEFNDVLPSGLTLVSAMATSGTAVATVGTNTVTWNGNIPSSSSVTITITATINSIIVGTIISNQGAINYDADGNGTNEANALTDDPTVGGPTSATNFTVCSASLVVTTNADSGAGSLRQAIIDACDGATITFAPALSGQTITLTTAELTINKSLTIQGPGATMLTVSGNNGFRVFKVTATGSAIVSFSGLTIANGVDTFSSPFGAGISNNSTATVNITDAKLSGNINDASGGSGGGFANNSTGTVNVTNSTFDHNSANGHFGGGIYNASTGTVNVTNCTFDTNSGGSGGGIASTGGGTLKVTNSTFNGNSCPTGQGGAIYSSAGTLTVEGSTLSGNSAFHGGGITRGGSAATLGDSIVALNIGTDGSTPNPDLDGTFTSEGYNLIGNNLGATITATTGDQIGTQFAQIDPKLDTLKDNGGLTKTMALLTTSPAIDQGKNLAALATDQRGAGFPRPYDDPNIANATSGDGSDIGAWEGPQPQSITVNTHAPANATYNTSFTVAATSSSGLAVSYSSSGSCTNVGATFTMTSGTGTCTVKYDQAGNTNFNAAPQVTELVNAQKASQTLSIGTHAPSSAPYNTSFTVAATSTSGLAVAYSSAGVCTNVGATFTITSGAGTCTVRYDQPGDANYNAAGQLTESVTAQKASQTITVGTHAPANATFNTSFTVAATSNSSLIVTYSSSGVCTNVGATFTMTSGTGTCTVKYDQAGDGNYNAATQVTELVTAQKADQTITVGTHAPASAVFNTSFIVAATSNSSLTVAFSSSGVCTNVGATFTMTSGTGICSVRYDQAGNANYNAATQVTESVTAQKANQAMTVGTHAPANATFNTSFTVAATSNSSLVVAYSSSGVCTNVSATFTMTSGTGTCTVKYDQAGDVNYNAATQVTESVTAQKANQTITVGTHAPANATYNTNFTVAATSNSSLVVAYSSSGVCSNVGATFTMTSGTGTCTVKYDQAGDGNYNAATQVTESVTAQKASTSTGLASTLNPSTLGQSVTFTATVTSSAGTPTGTVQFKIDGVNLGSPITVNGSGVAQHTTSTLTAATHTVAADYSGDTNFAVSTGSLAGGQVVNNRPVISLSQSNYNVSEGTGFVTITVNRTGDLSVPVTVDYATDDTGASIVCATLNSGLSSQRCDFGLTLGTLRFAATETQKSFAIPITQDSFNEGPEVFNVNLSNPTGTNAILAGPSSGTVTISDSPAPAPNASDDTDAFVRQQYRDFLAREADPSGLAFWKNNIDECNDPARRPPGMTLFQCIEVRRIDTSAAFFLSIEFQQTGNLVRSFYVASLNRPLTNNMPAFVEFERDRQAIATGIIVGQGNWEQALLNNRDAFLRDFVTRAEFVGLYPTTDTPAQYVDKLYLHASLTPTATERAAAIAEFGGAATASDAAARGRALFDVTQNASFQQREANRSFVQMEYFGYLRRNPNDAPDGDFVGFDFWLTKLNAAGGNYISSEMVKAFLSSIEYRKRFGP